MIWLFFACGDFLYLKEEGATGSLDRLPSADWSEQRSLRHYAWDGLLRQETAEENGIRKVGYSRIYASAEATSALEGYLSELSTVDPTHLEGSSEKMAFWLNLYNAWVLWAATERLAADPEWRPDAGNFALFSEPFVQVDAALLSLDDVEKGVFRGEPRGEPMEGWHVDLWGNSPLDARFHMGLVCASTSCPSLGPGAYQARRLEEQLEAQTLAFLQDERRGAGPEGVSEIFRWYEDDFVQDSGSVRAFVARYRDPEEVDFNRTLFYDWSLNSTEGETGAACSSPW